MARAAVAQERTRIARELHDVVAHSVSTMVLQASGARQVLRSHTDEADDAMHSVEVTGGRALRELRRMLGILRTDDRPSDLRDGAQAVVFAHESGVVRPSPTNEPAAGA